MISLFNFTLMELWRPYSEINKIIIVSYGQLTNYRKYCNYLLFLQLRYFRHNIRNKFKIFKVINLFLNVPFCSKEILKGCFYLF